MSLEPGEGPWNPSYFAQTVDAQQISLKTARITRNKGMSCPAILQIELQGDGQVLVRVRANCEQSRALAAGATQVGRT